MKAALVFSENNGEVLVLKEYPTVRAMKNGQYYLPLKNAGVWFGVADPTERRKVVLRKEGIVMDTAEISVGVKRVWMFGEQ